MEVDSNLVHDFFRLVERLQDMVSGRTDPTGDAAASFSQGGAAEGQPHDGEKEEEEDKKKEEEEEQDLNTQVGDHSNYCIFIGSELPESDSTPGKNMPLTCTCN